MAQPSVMSACHALPKPLYTIEDNEDNFTEYAWPALISRQVTVCSTVPPYSQVGMGWGPLNLEDTVLIWNAIKDNNAAKKYSLSFSLSYTSTRISPNSQRLCLSLTATKFGQQSLNGSDSNTGSGSEPEDRKIHDDMSKEKRSEREHKMRWGAVYQAARMAVELGHLRKGHSCQELYIGMDESYNLYNKPLFQYSTGATAMYIQS
ncbi:hypothetical protein BDP27DRAFT_1452680 [Rhodocollybia butyracea]|uniref:Uncharacterized protein n=1 Tax=Rhodocollybia butyracea TaxID=206335 RepID=A0A9P5PC88_9AGAR|nr:hypothetical protein BDP27DRAFT_1452680 [Rhodocollybia butyracea]